MRGLFPSIPAFNEGVSEEGPDVKANISAQLHQDYFKGMDPLVYPTKCYPTPRSGILKGSQYTFMQFQKKREDSKS